MMLSPDLTIRLAHTDATVGGPQLQRGNGLGLAFTQTMGGRPTRAALALETRMRATPFDDVARDLESLNCEGLCFDHDRPSPAGSLGQACENFWRSHALRPFALAAPPSPSTAEKLLYRKLLLHDVLHVLLDFKPDWPGQLGVSSFLAAQKYCPQFELAARRQAQAYTTFAPWLRGELADAEARGRRLGFSIPRLLTMPIECEWDTSLASLRDQLGIRKMRKLRPIEWRPA